MLWTFLSKAGSRPDAKRGQHLVRALALSAALAATGLTLPSGCLDRPVIPGDPNTSNVFVDPVVQDAINKIDLLFTIDNSASMADKQAMLKLAVPSLLNRLINPLCVAKDGSKQPQGPAGCPTGFVREFRPIDDIHIGVVTSSLGSHGGSSRCSATDTGTIHGNDKAELLTRGLPAGNSTGFLAWEGAPQSASELVQQFQDHVIMAGETGCGFEATLESWYRFLVDPEPPADVVREGSKSVMVGTNETILAQRRAFLRPDSLVAIIMLSDENDCSIIDSGAGYLIADPARIPHGSSQCDISPNDPCCRSCGLVGDNSGCLPALVDDAACIAAKTDGAYDREALRCYAQKERYGIDLLYPTSRYVDALTKDELPGRDGTLKPNPLFVNPQGPARSKSLVFLAGIVGVPWQDIASSDTLGTPDKLRYLTATELNAAKRWDVIVGDINADVAPTDPFMHEQVEPRTGANPITGALIGAPTLTDPHFNAINGHDYLAVDDLQYACIYKLPPNTRDCAGKNSCDCAEGELSQNKPLCNPDTGGPATTQQVFAKAYPGLRELEVLKGYAKAPEANSIVASICPKVPEGETTNEYFGYNPAVEALIARFKNVLNGRCLPRPLAVVDGAVPCAVVEVSKTANCSLPSRVVPAEQVASSVLKELEDRELCKDDPGCGSYTLCELLPAGKSSADGAVNPELYQDCLMNESTRPENVGYCYIDEAKRIGSPDLVSDCPATERRKLRFIGENTPANGAVTFIVCVGESLEEDSSDPPVP